MYITSSVAIRPCMRFKLVNTMNKHEMLTMKTISILIKISVLIII